MFFNSVHIAPYNEGEEGLLKGSKETQISLNEINKLLQKHELCKEG